MKKYGWAAILAACALFWGGCTLRSEAAPTPTPAPTAAPTAAPETTPTPEITPTPEPTAEPTVEPSAEPEGEPAELPEAFPLLMEFSSGAGGWGTELTLERNGAFSGRYHDSEMGDMGDGYPNGTVYIATFDGWFTDIRLQPDGTYTMRLDEVTTMDASGDEWIQDGVRFIASEAYGLETAETGMFRLYPPETETAAMDEEFISWWPGRFDPDGVPETLGSWALENVDTRGVFFSYG